MPDTLMLLGLRRGEAAGAMVSDFDGDTLRITRQRTTQGEITGPKTPESARRLPLPSWLVQRIKADSGPMFLVALESGAPPSYRWCYELVKDATGLHPHALRAVFASHMENEAEAPGPVVQALLGHKDGTMKGKYSKAREAQLARWLERHLAMVCPQEQVKEKEAR